ncbi:winged helix-turn-helix transcriptional regulator [Kozakia baliensis]|uniref:winged helix-turn-helix transcriptional regulator n=1 Tax=Kozakia baliensis TaxID=153496 RepID=UPI000689B29F|nr:winged helix-turn-helix transcriptional regulator [Kozakia baliensis]
MLLRIVQPDNKMPQRQIAEKVNLSAAAVRQCIAAMEKTGVILCNSAVVAPRAVQMNGCRRSMRPKRCFTTHRLFAQNGSVASHRSLIALDRVKFGSDIIIS